MGPEQTDNSVRDNDGPQPTAEEAAAHLAELEWLDLDDDGDAE